MKSLFRRPSPAMVIAIVALFAALGGSAMAAKTLNKKKVKNIANNVVTQRAPGLSVAHAASADKVGPLSAAKFDYRAANNTGTVTIGNFGGFVLQGTCAATNDTQLTATSGSSSAEVKTQGIEEGGTVLNDSFDTFGPGDTVSLNEDFAGPTFVEGGGTFEYQSQGGNVATGTWATEDSQSNFANCNAWGTAFNS